MKKIYLVRHGHADFKSKNYDQLTDVGIEQSKLLGQYFQRIDFECDEVYLGGLNRQKQTFDNMNEYLHIPNSTVFQDLKLNEFDFQNLMTDFCNLFPAELSVIEYLAEPSSKKNFFRCLKQAYTAWSEGQLQIHSESYTHFRQRVASVLKSLKHSKAKNILVVSSGGILSHMIADTLKVDNKVAFDLNLQINNTSISSLLMSSNSIKLTMFNSIPHIDEADSSQFLTY